MRAFKQLVSFGGGLLLAALLVSCGGGSLAGSSGNNGGGGGGGGGGTGGGSNAATVTVDGGATGNSINTLFVTLTVCAPGTSTCQSIDNIQVDTGSYGLRVLAPVLTVTLPTQSAGGGTLLECTNFVDGFTWGPVVLADVKIAGETANNVPVQVIGDQRFPNPATDCAALGTEEDTVDTFGANGILGVGPFQYDCGTFCRDNTVPTTYYTCTSTAANSCASTAATLAQQVQSVVAKFATDNNGVIIDLPAVSNPLAGASTLSGSLIFGIDTQTNNASGTETVLTTDQFGEFTISFQGQRYDQSFIDSGTNGNYFNSALTTCTQSGLTDFYCPSTEQSLSATLTGINTVSYVQNFKIGNTYTMLSTNNTFTVFPELGGTYPGSTPTFDFGLPFFYGKRLAVALEGEVTGAGTGPYFAF